MDDDEPTHPGHHDCFTPVAARLNTERFIMLLDDHAELHDLMRFSDPGLIGIIAMEEGEE